MPHAAADRPRTKLPPPDAVRYDWTRAEVRALFALPFPELMFAAQCLHRAHCFLAGANSIFYRPKLLTTANPDRDHDQQLLDRLGLIAMDDSH